MYARHFSSTACTPELSYNYKSVFRGLLKFKILKTIKMVNINVIDICMDLFWPCVHVFITSCFAAGGHRIPPRGCHTVGPPDFI